MEWVKTTAKTLPEAIDLALDNLGVDESEAEIVVLEEPRQGLFGRMRGTARVEARVKPKAIRPKAERSRNRKGRGGEGRNRSGGDRNKNRNRNRSGGQGGNRSDRNSGRSDSNRDSSNRDDSSGRNDSNRDSSGDERKNDKGSRNDGGRRGSAQGGRGRNNRSGGDRSNSGGGGRGKSSDQGGRSGQSNQRSGSNRNEAKPKEESSVEEVAEHLETFLNGLTHAFGYDSTVSVDRSEDDVLVGRIEGQHGLLVGPKGRTLDAVQELARISCQRTVPSSIRIKVDVGGYREQRQVALAAFAAKAADSAVESDDEVALEPMSAADRKVIHDALSEDDRVETRSVGTEPRRKVLVVPLGEPAADDTDEDVDDDAEDVAAEHSNGAGEATDDTSEDLVDAAGVDVDE